MATKKRPAKAAARPAKGKGVVQKVMHEFKEGDLTTHGQPVRNPKQAIAIALNEAREAGADIAPRPGAKKRGAKASKKTAAKKAVKKASKKAAAKKTSAKRAR